MSGPPGNWTVRTVQFCTPTGARSNVYDMNYFIAATQGLDFPSPRNGIPMAVLPEPLFPRAWGVEHATPQARYALELL